jgi:hypothetical protein
LLASARQWFSEHTQNMATLGREEQSERALGWDKDSGLRFSFRRKNNYKLRHSASAS